MAEEKRIEEKQAEEKRETVAAGEYRWYRMENSSDGRHESQEQEYGGDGRHQSQEQKDGSDGGYESLERKDNGDGGYESLEQKDGSDGGYESLEQKDSADGGYQSQEQEYSGDGGCQSQEQRIQAYEEQGCMVPEPEMIRTEEEIQGIRESSRINIAVLDAVGELIAPGITTEEIDRLVYTKTRELGGSPAPLGYDGYEKSVCTSVNSQACHGIPSESVVLQEGDIVNVDVSTVFQGYFSDSSRMFCVGRVSGEAARLVETARQCVREGIAHVRPWTFLGDMAAAIQQHALEQGYCVVSEMGGHGIGLEFHAEPFVSYTAPKGTEMLMVPGMVFTIEPIINQGTSDLVPDPENGWTLYTADGGLSAQWEVTVAVTEDGCEVLTY